MLQLLVGGCGGNKQTVTVADGETPNEARTCDRAMHHRNHIGKLGLEGRVKIRTAANRNQTVCIRKPSKHANLGRVFKLTTNSHDASYASIVCVCGGNGDAGRERKKE